MKLRGLVPLIAVLVSADCRAQPTTSEAQVVLESLKAIDNCYHWAGETGDQNEQRNKDIADGISRDCPVAQERARNAYSLYPKNAALSAGLLKLIDVGDLKVSPGVAALDRRSFVDRQL